ncbi:hypothetical protein [Neobacillus sp. NPDC093127]|uniref:hypothetical protein n=1 Tax=Neobacillus sp. NPDC093127 TaxID=3364296 RepID=UPI00382F4054
MKVEINMASPVSATIKVDDKELKGVTGIKFEAAVGLNVPSITLSLIPSEINIAIENAMVFEEKNLDQYSPEELLEMVSKKLTGVK